MKNLGIQLFTIRDFMKTEEDIRDSFERLAKMGYTQVQTAGCEIPYEKFGALAKEFGLEIVGTHDDFELMVEDFDAALARHKALGTTNMGIGGFQVQTYEELMDFIEKANVVAKKCKENGMKFTYHNHAHEFFRWPNGKTTMDILAEELDPEGTSIVFDTYWCQVGGANPTQWIKEHPGRIDIVHFKDMRISKPGFGSQQMITECGHGNLDFKDIYEACKEAGVKYYVVEQDRDFEHNCFASAKFSYNYLTNLLAD